MNTDARYAISKWNWSCRWSMILFDVRTAALKQIEFTQHLDWFSKEKDFIERTMHENWIIMHWLRWT